MENQERKNGQRKNRFFPKTYVVKVLFPTKKTATKCVAIRNFSKSQKMLSKVFKVFKALFTTQKTATKCVIIAAGQTYHHNKRLTGVYC